jgi:hypothetical protein
MFLVNIMLEHIFKHYGYWEEYGRVDQKNYDKKFDGTCNFSDIIV